MILELDLGNTRCKWRLRDESIIRIRGDILTSSSFETLESSLNGYKSSIAKVWVASVVDAATEQALSRWCLTYLSLTPAFARSTDQCRGVTNGYRDPSRLGVDRWLGMIACYQDLQRSFVLASFGTAITVDLVGEDGKHFGGFIAPGLRLMLTSLRQKTQQVIFDFNEQSFNLASGTTTDEAVYNGVTAMIVGLIDNGERQLQELAPIGNATLIFTGGDAQRVLPYYPQAQHRAELVLDGLAYVLGGSK